MDAAIVMLISSMCAGNIHIDTSGYSECVSSIIATKPVDPYDISVAYIKWAEDKIKDSKHKTIFFKR